MNQDFHYNATYFAAALAGYSHDESLVIAHAAQFVDDCTAEVMPHNPYVHQIPTCEDTTMLLGHTVNPFPYSESDIGNRLRVWSYFHFLPGNLDLSFPYEGPREQISSEKVRWCFFPTGADAFRLLCLPNSPLALEMINRLVTEVPRTPFPLERIGLSMHVLADTWAHSFFSGTPHQCTNDVIHSLGLHEFHNGSLNEMNCVQSVGDKICDDKPDMHLYGVVKVDSTRFASPLYLGHGRAGHLPDYAYCDYHYVPFWKSELPNHLRHHNKNNQVYFLSAFKQLVAAMKAIRSGTPYKKGQEEGILNKEIEADIKRILAIRTIDLSSEWNKLILKYCNQNLQAYDAKAWINAYNALHPSNDAAAAKSHYVGFTHGAKMHFDWLNPMISDLFFVKNTPFTVANHGLDIDLSDGVLRVDSPLQIHREGDPRERGIPYVPGTLPGIESIQIRRSMDFSTGNIALDANKRPYEYTIVVRGGCPKGYPSIELSFYDRAGDFPYTLSIIDSTVKNHYVSYNSTNPEIVLIHEHIVKNLGETTGNVWDTLKGYLPF